MGEPLVSIIITSYKGSDSIQRAIASVLSQTYKNIEIIVVDDNGIGSEEQIKTQKIVEQYKTITYIAHEKNQNGSNARNTGATYAKGDFFCFLDDDDEFLPQKIERQIQKFLTLGSEYGLVYCSFNEISNSGRVKTEIAQKSGEVLIYSLLDQVKIATSLFMVKRDVFEALNGFDGSFKRHQDWEFVARLASKYKVDYVEDILVIKHSLDRNLPRDIALMEKYRLHYLQKLEATIALLPRKEKKKVYCYHYLCFVKEYVKRHSYKKFIEYLFKSHAPFMYCRMFFQDMIKSYNKKHRKA